MRYEPGIYYYFVFNAYFCAILKVKVDETTFESWDDNHVLSLKVVEHCLLLGNHQKDQYMKDTVPFNRYQELYKDIDELLGNNEERNDFFYKVFNHGIFGAKPI